ncbi:hypothetical protein C8R43DRAFT_1243548 [Mycena crocata]|nr:hypothetical protein C8R43DRAFT_1243548 [Mycena crocata]
MPPTTRLVDLVRYSTVAASTAREIADSANVPFLQMTASLTASILTAVQTAKFNKEQCIAMVEQIHEILCTIIHLYCSHKTEGVLPPPLLYDIAKFTETLQKLYALMKTLQGMGRIRHLFKQADNSAQLKECQEELHASVERFRIHAGGTAIAQLASMQEDAQRQHEELVALLAEHPDLTNSERAFSVTGTLSSLGNSSGSLSILPAPPQIFHGRDSELRAVLWILAEDFARVAILGAGGMGKTSLAVAVLHQPDVVNKFPRRYCIPCHSTANRSDLISSIASHLGVTMGPNLARRIVRHLSASPPVLMILDNFETPWEPASTRAGVEEFLSLLGDIAHLALIVTMRGAERPNGVKWTRPFLPALEPLNDAAALEIFTDIADDDHDTSVVRDLLHLTGNMPLAVSLMANVVTYDGCDATLARWRTESTRVVSDGYDKKSSLDISIMLSFTSARMTPEAQELLSILSLLPDGLSDVELLQSNIPISNIRAAKATLLRTSLAYVGRNGRLLALVPIREHVRGTHPPSSPLKFSLRQYFYELIELWKQFRVLPSPEVVVQLSANLGNINAILADGLTGEDPDVIRSIESVLKFSGFCRMKSNDPSPLMPLVAEKVVRFPQDPVYGTYFIDRFFSSRHSPIRDPDAQIALANQYFDEASDLEKAQWYNALAAYYSDQGNQPETSIRYRQMVVALMESSGEPLLRQGQQAMTGMANTMCTIGNYQGGRLQAQKAQQASEVLGDILSQAQAVGCEARCCLCKAPTVFVYNRL